MWRIKICVKSQEAHFANFKNLAFIFHIFIDVNYDKNSAFPILYSCDVIQKGGTTELSTCVR